MLDLGDGDAAGRRHHRVKVARGLAINQIAFGIAFPGMHDGEVGDQSTFHDVLLAIEFALFLILGNQGADAGLGVKSGNARAAGADALGQGALRVEFDFQFAGEILLGEGFVFADIRGDHFLDLPALQQQAEAGAVDAGIIRNEGEVLHPGIANGEDQRFRDAAKAKSAGHDQHAVFQQPGESRICVGKNLFHTHLFRRRPVRH